MFAAKDGSLAAVWLDWREMKADTTMRMVMVTAI